MKKVLAVTAAIVLLSLGSLAQATIIDTVPVGNPGNAADTAAHSGNPAGQGSVGYAYNIGKYEVTAGQYTDFLNKVAATDTYALYNTGMSNTSYGSGITRSGALGGYTYSVATDFINRPVNYVSYWDSGRFANWLHNGQPTGLQNALTTEDGAYLISGYNGYDGRTIQRKDGWKWAVTSEDEWYKAAYYKGGGTTAGYWDYPTSSDTAPGQDMADASGNNANHATAPYAYPIDSGKYTTVAGEFQNSESPYGTFDQGGNVWEWNESIVYQDVSYAYRGVRGGSLSDGGAALHASGRYYGTPTNEFDDIGFRVSELVPEPCDTSPPTTTISLSGTLGNNGWYVSDVQVALSAADEEGGSGVAKTEYSFNGSDWITYTGPFPVSAEGTTTVYYRSTDNAGNVEPTKTEAIKIDKTPPQVTISVPTNVEYLLNQVVLADWSAADSLSGLASAVGTVPSGQAIDTATVGMNIFSVVATDNAGNQAQQTVAYGICYAYSGVLQPINPDGSSIFKLGSTVPVKFQLRDAGGNYVANAIATIYLAKISGGIVGSEMEAVSTSAATTGNLFRFDGTSDQYIFNLGTKPLSVGTWRIRILLDDGTSKYVMISLK